MFYSNLESKREKNKGLHSKIWKKQRLSRGNELKEPEERRKMFRFAYMKLLQHLILVITGLEEVKYENESKKSKIEGRTIEKR